MKRSGFIFLFILLAANSVTFAQFTLQNAFPNLTFSSPLDLQHAGDGTDRIFVVERAGRIKVFQNSANTSQVKIFLDITDRVVSGGELGLLGLAFHPDYENNGYLYVNYTSQNPNLHTRISRFKVTDTNPDSADKNSEQIILTYDQPYSNHNGGCLAFGPDGYLYIASGDGGSGGDPQNNAQSVNNLLGKILRIDIDNPAPGLFYSIPPDNPFVDSTGTVRKEIFAWGLRNPWRFSFDSETGTIWCADVGQDAWEEIDIIQNGKNYGWRCYEGNHPYNLSGCNYPEYIFPVWEYSHSIGASITGGYVYRGPNVPEIFGQYIYGDYSSKKVWALKYDGITPPINTLLLTAPGSITSFGVDKNNELYIVSFDSKIYRFLPTAPIIAPSNLNGLGVMLLSNPPDVIVMLDWNDNSDNEEGFIIERKTVGSDFVIIDSVQANQNSFVDINVIDSTIYTYRVRAFAGNVYSGYSNSVTVTTPLRSVNSPTSLIAQQTGINLVELSWIDNDLQEEGYKIERKLGENGQYYLIDSVAASIVNYSDTTVTSQNIYYYRVYAYIEQIRSDYSNEDSAFVSGTTEVKDLSKPVKFELFQNYPNPFNPATVIKYSIPERNANQLVKLVIYDVIGRIIKTLVEENQQPGVYEINFDAPDLPSGIYFYQLSAGDFRDTKKMILLK
ncbi:MAG: PQQ-dependent sugar dehydrogenase [Ignavibacteriaceae bacterium]|nr:PQQ-dependent sugar dehydrogenase [Ignavibacteriaceae bacterium]